MPRLTPTGRARVYRTGSHDYTEMPLEEARRYVLDNPGYELYGIMQEDYRDR